MNIIHSTREERSGELPLSFCLRRALVRRRVPVVSMLGGHLLEFDVRFVLWEVVQQLAELLKVVRLHAVPVYLAFQ